MKKIMKNKKIFYSIKYLFKEKYFFISELSPPSAFMCKKVETVNLTILLSRLHRCQEGINLSRSLIVPTPDHNGGARPA